MIDDLEADREAIDDDEVREADEESAERACDVDPAREKAHGKDFSDSGPDPRDDCFPAEEENPAETADDERGDEDGASPRVAAQSAFLEREDY